MTRKRLAVVVVNYKTPEMTTDCLATLEDEIDPAQDVVLVVDNASPDSSAATLREEFSRRGWQRWVRLLTSDVNRGFSGGNNLGIEAVSADFYLLLNSDTLVQPGAISRLIEAAGQFPRAGLLGPRLEDPNGTPQTSCFRYHSPFSQLILSARTGPVTRLLRRFDVPLPVREGPIEPEWISFACVLVRSEVFEKVGLMDDGYFMYFEDVDYCRQAQKAGWDIRYCAEARVTHFGGASSPVEAAIVSRKRPPRYYYQSRTRYFAKFYGRTGLLAANLLWGAGRSITLARELVGNKKPHACRREAVDIWTAFCRPLTPAMPPPDPGDSASNEDAAPKKGGAFAGRSSSLAPRDSTRQPMGVGTKDFGVVVIGRNEGDRLGVCLESVLETGRPVVYVDSGSTDGSAALARSLGAEVLELDSSRPFSAARARNEGYDRLNALAPETEYVQFVDGDCKIVEGWFEAARQALDRENSPAIVTGRIHERRVESSVYHLLCHLEWQQPIGKIDACGGILMVRGRLFEQIAGFDPTVVAAEDDEFCLRVRRAGGRVERLAHLMAIHDIGEMSFSRWWLRATRAGLGYAQGVTMHGRSAERHFVKRTLSAVVYGSLLPLAAVAGAWPSYGLTLLLLLVYPLLGWRVYRHGRLRGFTPPHARACAVYTVLGKFPETVGIARYCLCWLRGWEPKILEHNLPHG